MKAADENAVEDESMSEAHSLDGDFPPCIRSARPARSLADNAGNLPASARTVVIEGGNHAGFGEYGAQKGDSAASISVDEQQQRTADLVAELIG